MKRLKVNLGSGQCVYPILVKRGALKAMVASLGARPVGRRYAVISDHTVRDLYGEPVLSHLSRAGISARLFSFPAGEPRKNLKTIEALAGRMLKAGFSRDDAIIALGGGVVGDVAGFVAASYMRGIPFVQAPTTLVSMVDSSIGGKVAVDLAGGKNIVGHFWHPSRVFIDPSCLDTLPLRQRRNGWVEVIKHGVIADRRYFDWLERKDSSLLRLKGKAMEEVLARSLRIKTKVVETDQREADYRKVLNYGHTIGHAIESLTRYQRVLHGEAVAIGMNVEGRIACHLGLWRRDDLERQNRLLRRLGLKIGFPNIPTSKLVRALRHDKKVTGGDVTFALPRRLGAMASRNGSFGLVVEPTVLIEALDQARS